MRLSDRRAKAHNEVAAVVSNVELAPRCFRMTLHAPGIAEHARPGQFVSVLTTETALGERVFADENELRNRRGEPWHPELLNRALIRRPFSFSRIDRTRGQIWILFRVIGKGTEAMARMEPGREVPLLGPLGNGFDIGSLGSRRTAILVGGGIGIAPFFALAQELRRKKIPAVAFFGGIDEVNLPIALSRGVSAPAIKIQGVSECLKAEEYEEMEIPTAISTEKGRRGFRGYVSALLDGYLTGLSAKEIAQHEIFTCGPWGMLEAIAEIARRRGLPCQVLLEGVMGCGLGVCMSCVCDVRMPDGSRGHKRICIDGPMFRAEEIDWTGGPHGHKA